VTAAPKAFNYSSVTARSKPLPYVTTPACHLPHIRPENRVPIACRGINANVSSSSSTAVEAFVHQPDMRAAPTAAAAAGQASVVAQRAVMKPPRCAGLLAAARASCDQLMKHHFCIKASSTTVPCVVTRMNVGTYCGSGVQYCCCGCTINM